MNQILLSLFSLMACFATEASAGIIDNQLFEPSGKTFLADPLNAELFFQEFTMTSEPKIIFAEENKKALRFGKDLQLFPTTKMKFLTDPSGKMIFPASVQPQPPTSGKSYWHILWSPGKIWKDDGDGGLSRGLISFALVHPLDGETRHGFLSFTYGKNRQTRFQMQIVQSTTPWMVPAFAAWGHGKMSIRNISETLPERKERLPLLPWKRLEDLHGKKEGFEGKTPQEKVLASALYCPTCNGGKPGLFIKPCQTPSGRLPMCEELRFGNWSVGKSTMTSLTYQTLLKDLGAEIQTSKVKDVFPEFMKLTPAVKPGFDGWENVTLNDLMNMASGIGDGSHQNIDIDDGYSYHGDDPKTCEGWPSCENFNRVTDLYNKWGTAFSQKEKLTRLFTDSPYYPWKPNQKTHYRDQDYFLAGVMMERLFQKKYGANTDLWDHIQKEVLSKAGLGEISLERTIEKNKRGSPLWAWGMFPTLEESVRIALLFELNPSEFAQKALPTKIKNDAGEILYRQGFWLIPYKTKMNKTVYIPTMLGWGSNKVALFPNGMVGLQVASDENEVDSGIAGMANIAESITAF